MRPTATRLDGMPGRMFFFHFCYGTVVLISSLQLNHLWVVLQPKHHAAVLTSSSTVPLVG